MSVAPNPRKAPPPPLPVQPHPQADHPDLLTLAQSNIVNTALKRSRQRWLAPVPVSGTALIQTPLPRFSSTSRAKNALPIRQPPHRLRELGKADVKVGPHLFLDTKFFLATWLHEVPKPVNPVASTSCTQPLTLSGTTANKSSSQAASSSKPAQATSELAEKSITSTLITALNSAAREDAVLASHLLAASNGTADPDTLQALGRYIKKVQSELDKQAKVKADEAKRLADLEAKRIAQAEARKRLKAEEELRSRAISEAQARAYAARLELAQRSPTIADGGRVRKPTVKKIEAEEGEIAYSVISHRPSHVISTSTIPTVRPPSLTSFWKGPGKCAIVIEFVDNSTERWLVPPWALLEGNFGECIDVSFFAPYEQVGELPKTARKSVENDAKDCGQGAEMAPGKPGDEVKAPISEAKEPSKVQTSTEHKPDDAPSDGTAVDSPATAIEQPAAEASKAPETTATKANEPDPELPLGLLQPFLVQVLTPCSVVSKAFEEVTDGYGWTKEEQIEWFEKQWTHGGCNREVEHLQLRLSKDVQGPLAELVQGVDLSTQKSNKAKRKADNQVAFEDVDLFATPVVANKKRKRGTAPSRSRLPSGMAAKGTSQNRKVSVQLPGESATPSEAVASPAPIPAGRAVESQPPSLPLSTTPAVETTVVSVSL